MENHDFRKEKRKIPVMRYMFYLLFITSMVTGVTFSKYSTNATYSEAVRVARFDYDIAITDPREETDADLNLSITEVTSLSDTDPADFNEYAVVREITVINRSEVAVMAEIQMPDMEGNGIVWCIFEGEAREAIDGDDYYAAVKDKLSNVDASDFYELENELTEINNDTINDWNSDAYLGFDNENNSKTFTVVFWSEIDSETELEQQLDLHLTVSQIME